MKRFDPDFKFDADGQADTARVILVAGGGRFYRFELVPPVD